MQHRQGDDWKAELAKGLLTSSIKCNIDTGCSCQSQTLIASCVGSKGFYQIREACKRDSNDDRDYRQCCSLVIGAEGLS